MNTYNYVSSFAKKIFLCSALITSAFLTGCASVDGFSSSQTPQIESYAKSFPTPQKGYSGLYIIRENTIAGAALKKSLYVDGQYIGETAKGTYFYRLVKPGVHTLQTESEFGENGISVNFNEGENLTFEQKLKFGVFVGGAMLQQISKDEAIQLMQECTRAKDMDDKTQNLSTADYSENKGSIPAPLVQK